MLPGKFWKERQRMRILRETEAVEYLERLNNVVKNAALPEQPFKYFEAVLGIELSYFRRLLRDDSKRDLAQLAISASGFPELPSLMVDIKKAYEELDSIEFNIGRSVYPLLDSLNITGNLSAYDEGVDKVLSDFGKDQEHINLLKEVKEDSRKLHITEQIPGFIEKKDYGRADPWISSIFTKSDNPGLLYFHTEGKIQKEWERPLGWSYISGYLKYIDLKSRPFIVQATRNEFYDLSQKKREEEKIELSPDSKKLYAFFHSFNPLIRERILSIDLTSYSEEEFYQFMRTSSKMHVLLKNVVVQPETLPVLAPQQQVANRPWWKIWKTRDSLNP